MFNSEKSLRNPIFVKNRISKPKPQRFLSQCLILKILIQNWSKNDENFQRQNSIKTMVAKFQWL
jgi:hypothetical protein